VSVALTSRWLGGRSGPEELARAAREVGVPELVLDDPPPAAARWREPLKAQGVGVSALRTEAVGPPAQTLVELAAALRVQRLVVRGGAFEPPRDLAGEAAREPARLRSARERQVEALARRLHGPVGAGVPLAVQHARAPHELLTLEGAGWLLEALPRLMLWLDPAWALAASRQGWDAAAQDWADRLAGRVAGVSVHGLGSDGRGHAHPEDDGPPWGTLAASLPRRVPWALDLTGALSSADVREARRYLEAVLAAAG
jgi:hypothetical protein